MSFGGAVQAMITTLKNNKRDRKSRFDDGKTYQPGAYGEFVDHKKMSDYEFTNFKKKLIAEKKALRRKQLLVFGIVMLLFLVGFWLFAFGF